jgi:hypothetical protein
MEGVGEGLDLGVERDVDSVPTVMVLVPDEVDFPIDWGMEIDDVAASSGDFNEPDIPLSWKNAEYPR